MNSLSYLINIFILVLFIFIYSINCKQVNDNNEIIENYFYKNESQITLDDINVEISEEKCVLAIDSLVKLFEEGYIYTDIKKNPPNKEYFGVVDIISELKSIQTKDRKYYDFFRDIKRILGKIKDGHLNIAARLSPNGYNLQLMTMCLPFQFYISGEKPEETRIKVKLYDDCLSFYSDEEKEELKKYDGKNVKKINGTDPFDFIQNINIEFNAFYNKHSTFTYNMRTTHRIGIFSNPLSKEQLSNITFEFDDEELDDLFLDYNLIYKNASQEFDNAEFMDYYNKIRNQKKSLDNKSFLEIKNDFYKHKNKLKENNESDIEWQYSTSDGVGILCRVDEKNKLNVFKQTTFHFQGEDYINALEVVDNCTELFYRNPYRIVGIESYNGGGVCKLSFYFQELLQVKILPTPHYSTKISKLMKEYVEADIPAITGDPDMDQRVDIETCKAFSKYDDMKTIEDDYGTGVKHNKSQYFGIYNATDLKKHKKRREKYFDMNNLKRPTDIIIFTDTFSFSATSFFIKGFQETGAAIVVGYFGNPKNDELVDASQSPSFVGDFSNADIYNNLLDAGFEIRGVTIYESYNYTYQTKNPTPREYLIHPVDERINIYQAYDDSLYDRFIDEAKRIFKKYNEDKECNPNNLELLYDPNNKKDCYKFEDDEHAHGGYLCDVENKTWSNECKPYYCDIGYFFDKYQNKCIKDICTEEDNKNSKWLLIGLIAGSVVVLIIIIIVIIILKKKKEKQASGESGPLLSNNTTVAKEEN